MTFFEPELFSALSASGMWRTLRANSMKAYWNPRAGAEERPVAAAGELDPFEHAVETLEGAAGRGPQAVETFERLFGCVSRERRSGQPLGLDRHVEFVGGVLQGIRGGVVRAEIRVEVAQDSDANGVTHGLIVLEAQRRVTRE